MKSFNKPLPLIRNNNNRESKVGKEKTNLEKMMYYAKLSLVDGYNKKLKDYRLYKELQFLRKRVNDLEAENEFLREQQNQKVENELKNNEEELSEFIKIEFKQ